jgi:hypothetical protein
MCNNYFIDFPRQQLLRERASILSEATLPVFFKQVLIFQRIIFRPASALRIDSTQSLMFENFRNTCR